MHLPVCRPHSLVDGEMHSVFTCILGSLPVLGMVQAKTSAGLVWRKLCKGSAKDWRTPMELVARFHASQVQVVRANGGDRLHLTLLQGDACGASEMHAVRGCSSRQLKTDEQRVFACARATCRARSRVAVADNLFQRMPTNYLQAWAACRTIATPLSEYQ